MQKLLCLWMCLSNGINHHVLFRGLWNIWIGWTLSNLDKPTPFISLWSSNTFLTFFFKVIYFISKILKREIWFFFQAGVYGIVLCGIRNLRVWFGPLPTWLCYLHVQLTQIIVFKFSLFIFFSISLTRFMFICVWKRMREMNDDLIVRILVNSSIFLSVWMTINNESQISTRGDEFCSGDFQNSSTAMDWQEINKPKITRWHKFLPLIAKNNVFIIGF